MTLKAPLSQRRGFLDSQHGLCNDPPLDQFALGGLHMSNEPNNNLSQEAPQWMRDMFEELRGMFEGLFNDADKLNLEDSGWMSSRLIWRKTANDRLGDIMARAGPSYRGGGG